MTHPAALAEMFRMASPAADCGDESTSGTPASLPSRRRVSIGIWPHSGMSDPTAFVSEDAGRTVGYAYARAFNPREVHAALGFEPVGTFESPAGPPTRRT
jgi:hypothetical protein